MVTRFSLGAGTRGKGMAMRWSLLLLAATSLAGSATGRQQQRNVPVLAVDFPDPFVLPHRGRYLAYATNARAFAANVQMAESDDLSTWRQVRDGARLHDAMPTLPGWARAGLTWAPVVEPIGGRYVLYFTAREAASERQCVGVATSASPLGPFVSPAPAPLVCQRAEGGTIDPSVFRDADGTRYLLYKNDGNNPAVLRPARIYAQRLTPDGLALLGEARPLIRNDRHWEWRVVEAPAMVRTPRGGYGLFYSGNHFGWEPDQRLSNYAIGYARCAGPMGPCVKARDNPILKSRNDAGGCLSGPGHQTVFATRGRQYLAFHAFAAAPGCRRADGSRNLYIAPLQWSGNTPRIGYSLRPGRP